MYDRINYARFWTTNFPLCKVYRLDNNLSVRLGGNSVFNGRESFVRNIILSTSMTRTAHVHAEAEQPGLTANARLSRRSDPFSPVIRTSGGLSQFGSSQVFTVSHCAFFRINICPTSYKYCLIGILPVILIGTSVRIFSRGRWKGGRGEGMRLSTIIIGISAAVFRRPKGLCRNFGSSRSHNICLRAYNHRKDAKKKIYIYTSRISSGERPVQFHLPIARVIFVNFADQSTPTFAAIFGKVSNR